MPRTARTTKKRRDGKVIKLSRELSKFLDGLRSGTESYDSALRRHFGLPSRTGHPQPLRKYYVIDSPKNLSVFRTQAEAKGEAILLAVKRGQRFSHKEKKDEVLSVREMP